MKVIVTCHAMIGGSLQTGIPAVWQNPNGRREKPLARLGYHRGSDEAVRMAEICWKGNDLPRRQGVLVAIYPPRLKLSWEQVAPDLNFWPGGECVKRPGIVSGNCNGVPRAKWPHDRYELFLLFEGESMVICDSAMRTGIITVDNGKPCLLSPTAEALVDYIVAVGLRSDSHRSVTWALRNVEAIKRSNPRTRVADKLRQLEDRLQRVGGTVRIRS